MKKIINILWQDNQTKTERKRKEDKWHASLWQAFPNVRSAPPLYINYISSTQEDKNLWEKVNPLLQMPALQYCNSMINIFLFHLIQEYSGSPWPQSSLHMHNWKEN